MVAFMLIGNVKTLIENEFEVSPRLTGVFFRKNFGESMYGTDGEITDFALTCISYFNELKLAKSKHGFALRQRERQVEFEKNQASIKQADRQVSKSKSILTAKHIGSFKYALVDGVLSITSSSRTQPNLAKSIRAYLRQFNIFRLGQRLDNGVQFSGDAVTEILSMLKDKHCTYEQFEFVRCLITGLCYQFKETGTVKNRVQSPTSERFALGCS